VKQQQTSVNWRSIGFMQIQQPRHHFINGTDPFRSIESLPFLCQFQRRSPLACSEEIIEYQRPKYAAIRTNSIDP
jgi:hypothetical protein